MMKSALWLVTTFSMLAVMPPPAWAGKPEDVFKGKIIICKNRLPMRFSSPGAFTSAVAKARTDKVWPTEQKGNDHAEWDLEYVAFFAQPLTDNEVMIKFYDITVGKRMVASDPQYTRERGSRIFGSNIKLAMPEFEVNKQYMMTMESGRRTIATTTFWLRGRGPNYSGKVQFSDDEAKGR